MIKKTTSAKTVETLTHEEATRRNIPTAGYQSVLQKNEQDPVRVAYERRNRDREPEQVKAFRNTWRDGIHSYLTYLSDRLTVARNLLTHSGSITVSVFNGPPPLIKNFDTDANEIA